MRRFNKGVNVEKRTLEPDLTLSLHELLYGEGDVRDRLREPVRLTRHLMHGVYLASLKPVEYKGVCDEHA